MQDSQPLIQFAGLYHAALPLSILLIENETDRRFLTDLYIQYKALMFKVAYSFMKDGEAEDIVSASVERMCRYCERLKKVPSERMAAYIVRIVENISRTKLRKRIMEQNRRAFSLDEEQSESIPDPVDLDQIVLNRFHAEQLLRTFEQLSYRDQELIKMRHVDHMTYCEIAAELNMEEGAVRTAMCRAKKNWEKLNNEEGR